MDDLLAAASITDDPSSDHWREVISAVVFNGKPAELSCLDELSDALMEAGLVNAAYAWCVKKSVRVASADKLEALFSPRHPRSPTTRPLLSTGQFLSPAIREMKTPRSLQKLPNMLAAWFFCQKVKKRYFPVCHSSYRISCIVPGEQQSSAILIRRNGK